MIEDPLPSIILAPGIIRPAKRSSSSRRRTRRIRRKLHQQRTLRTTGMIIMVTNRTKKAHQHVSWANLKERNNLKRTKRRDWTRRMMVMKRVVMTKATVRPLFTVFQINYCHIISYLSYLFIVYALTIALNHGAPATNQEKSDQSREKVISARRRGMIISCIAH